MLSPMTVTQDHYCSIDATQDNIRFARDGSQNDDDYHHGADDKDDGGYDDEYMMTGVQCTQRQHGGSALKVAVLQ